MKKIIKYLALVPLLAIMLLNCVIYGQVIAAEDSTVDYSSEYVYFSEEQPEILELCDFRDFRNLSVYPDIFPDFEYYLYYGSVTKSSYDKFVNGSIDSIEICFYLLDLTACEILQNDYAYYDPDTAVSSRIATYIYDRTTNSWTKDSLSVKGTCIFAFFPDSFYLARYSGTINNPPSKVLTSSTSYCVAFDSNVIDVEFESGVLNALDVSVSFSPELHGAFTRTRTDRGQTVTLDNFSFIVSNNSKFPVQYLMAIYRDDEFFRPFNDDALSAQAATKFNGKTYTGNPTYVYVKDEWIYLPHGTQGVITANAPSSWHYLQSGEAESVTVAFNQVKLDINVNYTCVVYAIRNDSNYATVFTNYNTFQYPACSDYCVDVSGLSCVYTSQFNILNPAEFNPNNNDNSYAFDVDDSLLFNRANGYIDENGEVVVDRVDTNSLANAGKDPNDPWSGYNPDHNAWEVYYKNQNTVSSDIDQLSNNFSSFLQFVNKVFSYFPKNYQNIIILGLTSIVVIGILKVVF